MSTLSDVDAFKRQYCKLLRRVEQTFPANGALGADLVELRRLLGRMEIGPRHGLAVFCREEIEESLLALLDRVDLIRSAFAVEPYRGRAAIEIEAVKRNATALISDGDLVSKPPLHGAGG